MGWGGGETPLTTQLCSILSSSIRLLPAKSGLTTARPVSIHTWLINVNYFSRSYCLMNFSYPDHLVRRSLYRLTGVFVRALALLDQQHLLNQKRVFIGTQPGQVEATWQPCRLEYHFVPSAG